MTRSAMLAGTALALVFGGAVLGGSFDLTRSTPAFADAVQVQGVEPLSFADVVDKVRPAVVSVRVKSVAQVSDNQDVPFFDLPPGSPMDRFFKQFRQQNPQSQPQQARPSMSLGSGFFISDDGYVVTNNHVIDGEQSVTVITDDGTEYNAKVIGKDDRTDLALLKVDADTKFTYVKFAQQEPRVGDWVVAVGNPFGLGGTVTAGIISAHGRNIGAGPYDDFLQIDAAVNRGNSGGPAFNFKGEVVGINTAIFSPSGGNVGIAFAIPAATAERVVGDLQKSGSVVRGWLGVQIQSITKDIADGLQLPDANGALVAEIQSDSPGRRHRPQGRRRDHRPRRSAGEGLPRPGVARLQHGAWRYGEDHLLAQRRQARCRRDARHAAVTGSTRLAGQRGAASDRPDVVAQRLRSVRRHR